MRLATAVLMMHELRERATFAPARDRYKIFILDEAHMVTGSAFNALLKIVEEPPEHVMFILPQLSQIKLLVLFVRVHIIIHSDWFHQR